VSSEKRYESVDSVRVVCLLRVPGEEREREKESLTQAVSREERVCRFLKQVFNIRPIFDTSMQATHTYSSSKASKVKQLTQAIFQLSACLRRALSDILR
jgi:hypothetical protein